MRVETISATYRPKWVMQKPLYPVDFFKMELTPIEVNFVEGAPVPEPKDSILMMGIIYSLAGAIVSGIIYKLVMGEI